MTNVMQLLVWQKFMTCAWPCSRDTRIQVAIGWMSQNGHALFLSWQQGSLGAISKANLSGKYHRQQLPYKVDLDLAAPYMRAEELDQKSVKHLARWMTEPKAFHVTVRCSVLQRASCSAEF